jgi:cap1 methyltransferase
MDPSASLCIVYDSLKQEIPRISEIFPAERTLSSLPEFNLYMLITDGWYIHDNQYKLTPQYDLISTTQNLPPYYSDIKKYEILQEVKNAFESDNFIKARDAMNPFEKIGRSIFSNHDAIKLSNIDSVHHVTNQTFTFDAKKSNISFTFCDIASGPGGFTQYIQYRFPNSKGYGMTLLHNKLDWDTKFLDMTKFTTFNGPDKTGNLYTNWEHFINFVLTQEPEGVDLITGNGGFDNMDKRVLYKQEFLSSRLFLTQALIGIGCSKIGGNIVIKVFDTVTSISAQILFVLSQCFNKILIFKPVSSRPSDAERYVICMGRKHIVQSYYQLLVGAASHYQETAYLASLFAESLPSEFELWLIKENNRSIDSQLIAVQNILLYLGNQTPQILTYNIPKFLIIWNLPDTPQNPR